MKKLTENTNRLAQKMVENMAKEGERFARNLTEISKVVRNEK